MKKDLQARLIMSDGIKTSQLVYPVNDIKGLCAHLTRALYSKAGNSDSRRLVVSIAGVPGLGKTTLVSRIMDQLSGGIVAAALPQDGFHFSRADLSRFPDPQEALERRGAPFTFDASAFVKKVASLHSGERVTAPSFDHALKDPTDNGITIGEEVSIVLIEGNYVSLSDPVWDEIESYVDETWFVSTPLNMVRTRLISRHLASGICASQQEAEERADRNDLINAQYIISHSKPTQVLIVESGRDKF